MQISRVSANFSHSPLQEDHRSIINRSGNFNGISLRDVLREISARARFLYRAFCQLVLLVEWLLDKLRWVIEFVIEEDSMKGIRHW